MWIKQPWKAYSHPQDMFRGKGIGVNEGIDTLLHPLNNMLWPLHCLCWEDHFLYQGKLGSKQGGFDPCSPHIHSKQKLVHIRPLEIISLCFLLGCTTSFSLTGC